MKKILMVVTFLFIVAMVPVAHAASYTLDADDIWVNTLIWVEAGDTITFSGGQTHTDASEITAAGAAASNIETSGWVNATIDQWTWGVGSYSYKTPSIPRVWTDANGGSGNYIWNDPVYIAAVGYIPTDVNDPGLDADEWLKSAAHGALIGYIGIVDPLTKVGGTTFRSDAYIFEIGTATVAITALTSGNLYIGMNDDFTNVYEGGTDDNFGTATGNFRVPEPASMLLLFFGLMGVLGLRRKFKS